MAVDGTSRTGGQGRLVLGVAVACVVAAALGVGVVPAQAEPPEGGSSDPELGPLVAGASSYVDGVHVWTDYAYDDTGPNTDGIDGGDAEYPEGSSHNGADLIQLQLSADRRGTLRIDAVLETLVAGEEALVGVGFDTDGDPSTGAASVPGGGWSNGAPLGLELLVLVGTDGGGALLRWDGAILAGDRDVPVETDRDRNVVSAMVEGLVPTGSAWDTVGVVGLETAEGSWDTGAHPIQDLAYVRAEDPTSDPVLGLREQVPQLGFVPYPDRIQSDVLAGALSPHRAVAAVELGGDRTELAEPMVGYNTFLYHSRVDLPGEGVRQSPLQYRGPYMPYGVLIPPGLDERPGMLVFLHGANQHHRVNPVLFGTEGLVIPGPYDVPAVVIFPNGRDTGWGTALAEKDALDATDDAVDRLAVDDDRVVLTGVSSGGYGTFRMAARWPDRWAGGYSLVGGGTRTLENLTNVPFRASNGALDPLVNAGVWADSAAALDDAGTVDYRIVLVHNRSHDGPLAEGNCYYLDLLSRPRAVDPGRVRYTIVPDADENRYERPDGAYWVSGMASRDGDPASIDATSLAKPAHVAGDDIFRVDENLTKTADFCGPHPSLRGGNNWNVMGRPFAEVERAEPANELRLTLTNLEAATVDLDRAGLSTADPVVVVVESDGETELTVTGSWKGSRVVLRDGEPAGSFEDGAVVVDVVEGTHTYVVQRPGRGAHR